jgi:hypothetical protein
MTQHNDDLEKRVKRLEQEIEDSKNDRNLIKSLIRKLIDIFTSSEGRQRKAFRDIRESLKGNDEQQGEEE